MDKIKTFYHRRRDWVWLVIAIVIIIVATGNFPSTKYQNATSNSMIGYDGGEMMMEDSAMDVKSMGRGAMIDGDFIEPSSIEDQEEKIRKNASLNLEVEKSDYVDIKLAVDSLIDKHEGFYTHKNESVTTRNNADYYTYRINIKFKKDAFDSIIEEFRVLGEIKYFSINASDLTAQYYDTAAYQDAAKQVKARVQALLARANDIEDIISIETKLADLQRRIDNYQRQLTNIDRQTEYSQLSLTVTEKLGYTQSFYEMTKFKQLFKNVIQSIDNVFVKFSRLFGYLLVIFIIWLIYRGVKRYKARPRRRIEE